MKFMTEKLSDCPKQGWRSQTCGKFIAVNY